MSMPVMMDVNGILDCVSIAGPAVIRRKGSPTDNLCFKFCDNNRMPWTMIMKPLKSRAERFGLFLIGSGGVQHIIVI
jgi:hypothetical protein